MKVEEILTKNLAAGEPMLLPDVDPSIYAQVEIETKYAGYIKRQDEEIAKIRRHENMLLPQDMDYSALDGLSNELQQKLNHHKPTSLARAARIPGITPAALSILLVHAKKAQMTQAQAKRA